MNNLSKFNTVFTKTIFEYTSMVYIVKSVRSHFGHEFVIINKITCTYTCFFDL